MPPQITDDEASDNEQPVAIPEVVPIRGANKSKKMKDEIEETQQAMAVVSDKEEDDEEDGEDEEVPEGEYVIEAIKGHVVEDNGKTGIIKYHIKWEGYDKKSDMSWEPEENLEAATEILSEYLSSIPGGKEAILDAYKEKKAGGKGKKRARSSAAANGTPAKRGKTAGSPSPPAGAKEKAFSLPSGTWEDDVTLIDACEGGDNNVVVYLTWKTGHKTQHPLQMVYKKCPQKMLKFYESHLVFKKPE